MSLTFWSEYLDNKVPITALATNRDGHTIYIGNESGDIASVDIRKGTWRDTDRRLFGCLNGVAIILLFIFLHFFCSCFCITI